MKEESKYVVNSLYGIIARNKNNNKTALFCENKKLTYNLLNKYVENLSLLLKIKNIKKGDRVAIFMENSMEYAMSIFAISRLGAIVVPINTFLSSKEIEYIIDDANISVLMSSIAFEKKITFNVSKKLSTTIWVGKKVKRGTKDVHFIYEQSQASSGHMQGYYDDKSLLNDDAVIIYTSGTTGKPKGVILTNRNILSNASAGIQHVDITKKDRFIVFLPMFHAFTLSIGIVLPLYAGASVVIIRSVQPFGNIMKEILFKRVTIVLGVPDVYKALSKAKLPWYFLRFNNVNAFVSGASALHKDILDAMNKKFKRADILEAYGLTEAGPTVSLNPRSKQKLNSVGIPFPGYKIKIIQETSEVSAGEIGEVLVSGDNIMKGYLNNTEETNKVLVDGYLRTGDLGYVDEEGYLFLVGRKKDLIISKGMNIYPKEIEDVLNEHPLVETSAVIGKINKNKEEIVIAFVEYDTKEKIDILEFEKILKKYLKEYLALYKIPKKFYFSHELEKNSMGKIDKTILRKI